MKYTIELNNRDQLVVTAPDGAEYARTIDAYDSPDDQREAVRDVVQTLLDALQLNGPEVTFTVRID